jgi:hypothetical protein
MEPWYKVATPRKEVREGRSFNPDEFAIALEQVVAGTAPEAVAPDPPRGMLFPEMRPVMPGPSTASTKESEKKHLLVRYGSVPR